MTAYRWTQCTLLTHRWHSPYRDGKNSEHEKHRYNKKSLTHAGILWLLIKIRALKYAGRDGGTIGDQMQHGIINQMSEN
jgi:hypothetical protein